ncbi:VanW family protein [Desmospora activa]|uniref:Vancomycin resistance protein YoaR n=1 Tax=Desmospora activa DSM 45169 TaxID=1121389 RepID=A0A2T4ZB89_9BACL|nr:VanW family protein [Desmospora activa]PTM59164.1 vancomycin resistance protein YoaR [Desmospora activa DSM 45169]
MKTSKESNHPSLKHEVEIVERPPIDERTLKELPEVEVADSHQQMDEPSVKEEPAAKPETPTPSAEEVKVEEPPRRRMWSVVLPLMAVLLIGGTWWGWQEQWFFSGPHLILTHDDQTWTLDLTRVGYDGERPESVDREQLRAWLQTVAQEVDQPAQDARMKRWGDPIEQSEPGKVLDVAVIEEKWLKQLDSYIDHPQTIPMMTVHPKVQEEDFAVVDEKEWSVFTTRYDVANTARAANIAQSATTLDGRVVNPDETLSFLNEVGTEDQYGTVIRTVDGISHEIPAGGISQTASTLFNAVDQLDLEIIERHTYSDRDGYVAVGRDAFVRWGEGEKDFQFRNTLNHPILIRTEVGSGYVTIRIFSGLEANPRLKEIPPASVMVAPEGDSFEPLPEEELDSAPATEDNTEGSAPNSDNTKPSNGQKGSSPDTGQPDRTPGNGGQENPSDGGEDDHSTNPPVDSDPPAPEPEPGDEDGGDEPENPPENPGDTTSPEDPEEGQQPEEEGDSTEDERTIE